MSTSGPGAEVAEVLATCIRNACVNDGSAASGHEHRSAAVLRSVLEGSGVDLVDVEPTPGRRSLVARLEGSDPTARSLCLLGHLDVVPAMAERWRHDPFGGEVVVDPDVGPEVWGRGATDMLNLTCSMALAVRRLARSGFRPRGALVLACVADEEAMAEHGAAHLLEHHRDLAFADDVVTEGGGWITPGPDGPRANLATAEKGCWWARITVRGTPGHASRPHGSDSAVVKASRLVVALAELAPPARVLEVWQRWVDGIGLDADVAAGLRDGTDPLRIEATIAALAADGRAALATMAHACTHETFSPTILHGGVKVNVIPAEAVLEVDGRTLPGTTTAEVEALVAGAVAAAGLRPEDVEITSAHDPGTASPIDTPLFDALERAACGIRPDLRAVPTLMAGATDARSYRRAGAVAYGFGLFSGRRSVDELARMFHGDDERIDLESLEHSTLLYEHVVRDLLA